MHIYIEVPGAKGRSMSSAWNASILAASGQMHLYLTQTLPQLPAAGGYTAFL
jgi:hypothetical protein